MVFYEGPREPIEMPDWAFDRYTDRGRRMGRGAEHFFESSTTLVNEKGTDPYAREGTSDPGGQMTENDPRKQEAEAVAVDPRSSESERRRAILIACGVPEAEAKKAERLFDTEELREHFEVLGFSAPFVAVRRKHDGRQGVMMFTHSPRWYFNFVTVLEEGE